MRLVSPLAALVAAALALGAGGAACGPLRKPMSREAAEIPWLPAESAAATAVQIRLSRTPYQPGSIDGQLGDNVMHALRAFQAANRLPVTGEPDDRTRAALDAADGDRPLIVRYAVTADDLDGPFVVLPEGLYETHTLPCLCFRSAWEALAERFQLSPALLASLNPTIDLERLAAGDILRVPDPTPPPLAGPVAALRIDVDARTITALDANGAVLRQYPTVVGEEVSAYRGTLTIVGVARDPTYEISPDVWEELPRDWPAVTLPPGPNSPVGVVWMELSKDGYGIHGTSDPETIGHTESHGCVRLTNWSAAELADYVQAGVTTVDFVGKDQG
jgi:lipoprotein-anchoring transpeptidase ErfK/SrfK